ncbi:probable helicase senataxin isoform X1 [Podarcis raffonei]|uniref:probable helicase senataxin isoform X1 n=1 Tax=Podarcis raffonei TaxID=65483 RepID=UPI00232912AA|nr:probable helicase senataxin isoform X1 [Podarcis raffonei]
MPGSERKVQCCKEKYCIGTWKIRQWAILKARSLGKVDRDDYYNIQEVLTCLFRVIELDHFENSDTYNLAIVEKGNLILLPRHLYDTTSYKNYWLGICMLLMVLEEQAMDLLLFGPDKQIDFMPCIMKAMKKPTEDESINPFWPALHCFMVILDKLGSKVWGQVIDPIQAFQTIVNNASYQKARETVRQSCIRTKSEPMSDYGDEFVTCSQLAYDYHIEKPHKMAQEWLENQKSKEQRPFELNLLNFNADTNEADFTINISRSNLEKQLHPKECDLVFLILSEKQSFYSKEGKAESCPLRHVGYVTRFYTEMKEQDACLLSVKTQGNLSGVDKNVRCVVVSSLVTTEQMFKALLLLNRSPLAKAIISPQNSDFCLTGSTVDLETSSSYMKELNEDQRTAIETAYTFVMKLPSLPKVCLIHGPPGTGKSKTILGLLYRILSKRSGKENPVESKIKRNRVLVCAPSNAALDHLMKIMIVEFKEKCQDKEKPLGNCGDINLVRLGEEKWISKDVQKFSLDAQANRRMSRAALGKDQDIHKRKKEIDQRLDALSCQCAIDESQSKEKKQQLEQETRRLAEESKRLTVQLKEVCGRLQSDMKTNIILESHIICCTLSTSGSSLLGAVFQRLDCDPLSCVIVDMAMQACEVETIIPLIHGCKKLVLVGDPKQLPPTVKSMKAEDYGYRQSLMGRLCRHLNGQIQEKHSDRLPVLCLRTQYRMHPEICLFPSNYIYDHALKTDRWTEERRFSLEWPFLPYLLFDVLDGQEEQESNSFINLQEVKLVIELMKLIKSKKRDISFRNIGIITPCSAQKRRILSQLEKEFGENR